MTKPYMDPVKRSLHSPHPETASSEYDRMKTVIESVRDSLCSPQPELAIAEYMKMKQDPENLREYMEDQVQVIFNR
jgi:hypothetical protein